MKIISLILPIILIALYWTAYYCEAKKSWHKLSLTLYALGVLFFVVGMIIIGQVYHFLIPFRIGFLMLPLGLLPFAYIRRNKTVLVIALVMILLGIKVEMVWNRPLFDPTIDSGWLDYLEIYFEAQYSMDPNFPLALFGGLTFWAIGIMHSKFNRLKALSGTFISTGWILFFWGMLEIFNRVLSNGYGVYNINSHFSHYSIQQVKFRIIIYWLMAAVSLCALIVSLIPRKRTNSDIMEIIFLFIVMASLISHTMPFLVGKTNTAIINPIINYENLIILSFLIISIIIVRFKYLKDSCFYKKILFLGISTLYLMIKIMSWIDTLELSIPSTDARCLILIAGIILAIRAIVLELKKPEDQSMQQSSRKSLYLIAFCQAGILILLIFSQEYQIFHGEKILLKGVCSIDNAYGISTVRVDYEDLPSFWRITQEQKPLIPGDKVFVVLRKKPDNYYEASYVSRIMPQESTFITGIVLTQHEEEIWDAAILDKSNNIHNVVLENDPESIYDIYDANPKTHMIFCLSSDGKQIFYYSPEPTYCPRKSIMGILQTWKKRQVEHIQLHYPVEAFLGGAWDHWATTCQGTSYPNPTIIEIVVMSDGKAHRRRSAFSDNNWTMVALAYCLSFSRNTNIAYFIWCSLNNK